MADRQMNLETDKQIRRDVDRDAPKGKRSTNIGAGGQISIRIQEGKTQIEKLIDQV